MRLLASGDGTDYSLGIDAYPDGGPLGVGECRPGELFFDYEANVTYYIQLFDGQEDGGGNGGNLEFSLEEAPE
jgi:hypothetical protein